MNLAEMRSKFIERTSGLAIDLDNGQIDAYLNRAYQYTVPLDVGGEFGEDLWDLECEIGKRTYDQPGPMVGVTTQRPWLEKLRNDQGVVEATTDFYLQVDTDAHIFRSRYRNTQFDEPGKPTGLLVFGKQVTFNREPDQRYIVTIPVRSGPLVPLTDAGLEHEIHALAVVTASAQEYLTDSEDELGASREAEAYRRYERQLHTYAQSRPNLRRRKRSF